MIHRITCVAVGLMALLMTACDTEIEPADESTPSVTVYLLFGADAFGTNTFDNAEDRHNPCKYFDGLMNKAVQVDVRVAVPDPTSQYGFRDIYPIQTFLRNPDFPGGDPNGIGVQLPGTKGFVMIITIYGEPDPRCCPAPPSPVGRVVYRRIWAYSTMEGALRTRAMLPETAWPKIECLRF